MSGPTKHRARGGFNSVPAAPCWYLTGHNAVTAPCRPSVSLILTSCRSKVPDNSPIHTLPAVKRSFLNFEKNVTARCESNLFISRCYLSLLVFVIFNLKTAGITLDTVEFRAACLVSFLGPRTKEIRNAFILIFPLTNPVSVTCITHLFFAGALPNSSTANTNRDSCCGDKQMTSQLGRHFPQLP